MPINLTYEEFFKRVQGVEKAPTPKKEEEEVIEPDNYIYDENTFEMIENEKPKDAEFFDAPLSVQGKDRRRAIEDDDAFEINYFDDEETHPIIKEHINEYLIRNEKLSPEEQEIVKQHNKDFRTNKEWENFFDSHKQPPTIDNIPEATERTEEIFKNRYNLAINKTKITEMLIDSYFVYENDGEPEHNSTTIDNPETDANVEIYHKDGYDVVAFRGTESKQDINTDANTFSTKLSEYFPFVTPENDLMAHSGFVKAVASVYEAVKENIRNDVYDATGHSMGSSEVQIFAYVYLQDTGIRPRHLITFGSPRWCIETAEMPTSRYNIALDHLRIMNANDMITYYPTQDSTLGGISKFASAGAMAGGSIGQYAGGTGASMGGIAGGILGGITGAMASGGYKHVGCGLLLTGEKNAVLEIEGKEVKLKNKNYYIIPEDLDLARNPINFDKSLLTNIVSGGLYSFLNSYAVDYIKKGTAFEKFQPQNIFSDLRDVYNIQFMDQLETRIVKIISDNRMKENIISRPFYEKTRLDGDGKLWAKAENYLTGQILRDYDSDNDQIRQMKINIRRLYRQNRGEQMNPMEATGFTLGGQALEGEDYSEVNNLSNMILLRSLNAQLKKDSEVARDLYGLIGVQLMVRGLLDGSRIRSNYNHVKGHLFAEYFHNVGMLPNVIFEGATSFATKNEGVKYLGYAKNQFIEYPSIQNHILGFIFYPPEQEFLYQNNIIVY